MKKIEIIRNISIATIPACLIIFGLGWALSRNLIAASIFPLIFFVFSVYNNISKYFDDKKRDSAGVTKYRYKSIKAYDLVAPNDSIAPSLCIEIEGDKFLLLNGQWLFNEEIYGEEARKYYDSESNIFNCYNKPFSFPSTEFELWLSNLDNKPSKIIVLGDYIEPQQVSLRTPEKHYSNKVAIIDKSELKMN